MIVVGAGIIGVSIAYHLARRGGRRIVVLERESQLGTGATAKATGGIRHQFSTAVNIRLSQLSIPHLASFKDETGFDIGWRQHGYLFLATHGPVWDALRTSAALQVELGVPTRLLSPAEVRELVPQLRVDDLAGGTYCASDGSANPTEALKGYSAVAGGLGVEFDRDSEVIAIEARAGRVTGVRLANGGSCAADVVVDAAGPHVADIASSVGVSIPAKPFRRQVFVMTRDDSVASGLPFVVDLATGWYVHQEANGRLLFGGTDKDDRPGVDPVVDWDGFDKVARAALHRMPSVAERVRVETAYAGIRTLTPDFHAIIGTVPSPEGLVIASACNGHGFMHAPAVGQLVAELVIDGEATSIDITALSPARFAHGPKRDEAVMF